MQRSAQFLQLQGVFVIFSNCNVQFAFQLQMQNFNAVAHLAFQLQMQN